MSGGRSHGFRYAVNVSYGITDVDGEDDEGVVGNANRKNQNAFLNVMWTPIDEVMYGVEYGYFKTDVVNKDEVDASRLMVSAQYNF
ncbi:DcaP family trimeric outer membrane transporter [Chromohalobacter israelensis]|uniref:DcaP family trimeric outer membrane transporter n=1 Tax=Chromohalobacter israelensis TaxID=141390 RepID=UPI003D797E98